VLAPVYSHGHHMERMRTKGEGNNWLFFLGPFESTRINMMILLVGSTDRWRLRTASLTRPYLTSTNEHWRAAVIGAGRRYGSGLFHQIAFRNRNRKQITAIYIYRYISSRHRTIETR
jgi:hypothetical protein